MLLSYLSVPITLIYLEIVIFVLYLLITAIIKRTIKVTFTKKIVKKFIVGNLLASLLIIAISFSVNSYYHIGENEIAFRTHQDLKEAKELLDDNNIDYKVLFGNKIRVQTAGDVQGILNILKSTTISHGWSYWDSNE